MSDESRPPSRAGGQRPVPKPSAPPAHMPPSPRIRSAAPAEAQQPSMTSSGSAGQASDQQSDAPERTLWGQMDDLERWASSSLQRVRLEAWRIVLVRVLALASVLGAGVMADRGQAVLGTALAAGSALLVILDTAWPGLGSGRSVRQQAVHDLRELQNAAKIQWDRVRLTFRDPSDRKRVRHAMALLDALRSRREQIGRRLCDMAPSPPLGRGAL